VDKIAVRCKTRAEWDKVQRKVFKTGMRWSTNPKPVLSENFASGIMIGLPDNVIHDRLTASSGDYYHANHYTIISAQEYLSEGGKDVNIGDWDMGVSNVSEFKKGARVECIKPINMIGKGDHGTICEIVEGTTCSMGVEWDNNISGHDCVGTAKYGYGYWMIPNQIKLISTKTQTTKENNMNKNISDVFDKTKEALLVEKYLGAQIGNNFIDGLILLDKKVEVLAEAKRLEKEEKEGK
jgi:hypothetical protein